MSNQKNYYVYIMSNASKTLYTGVTNDLIRRVMEHKEGKTIGFTSKYNIKKLVYFEEGHSIEEALYREKQIKGWVRQKKIDLIEELNPGWDDLSEDWL
jgi:putative endonuclease